MRPHLHLVAFVAPAFLQRSAQYVPLPRVLDYCKVQHEECRDQLFSVDCKLAGICDCAFSCVYRMPPHEPVVSATLMGTAALGVRAVISGADPALAGPVRAERSDDHSGKELQPYYSASEAF